MKFLAIEHEYPGLIGEDFQPHLKAEAARVWELYQAGIIREMYFCPERSAAVLMLECAGAEEAQAVLDTLPLMQLGFISFELLALVPYSGFDRLFAAVH
jgi:hypothetical protein